MTKARILEAVREAKGDAAAQLIDHLKKPDMAKEAERLLAEPAGCPSRCVRQRRRSQAAGRNRRGRELAGFPCRRSRRTAPETDGIAAE